MPLTRGIRLGPYEILEPLGAGGMGEVYQARDTTLDRAVAVKILPPELATDADRLARLEREAKLLAALNHPNIAGVYSLERVGDRPVLVMELVPGPTLAERLSQPLQVDEALAVAVQIAHGLEAAHAKGIVHRDLKPANIKVAANGKVKLLDFGLAKAFAGERPGTPDLSNSPTMATPTMPGMILGTASYMSPEQARGRDTDSRTDVWAFGCVLYEMLTGAKTFPGDTVTDTLAGIVRGEPNWQALSPDVPAAIRSLLRRCLQKDPDRRLHHIADARIEIEDAMAAPAARPARGASAVRRASSRALPWAVAAIAIGALAVVVWSGSRRVPSAPPAVKRLELNLPAGLELFYTTGRTLTISPDGTRVAFIGVLGGSRQVYVRALDQFDSMPLRGTDGATVCFFSGDGRSIAFVTSGGALKTISLSDGLVATIAPDVSFLYGGAWGADGQITFVKAGALWQVPAAGGTAKPLTTLDRARQETTHAWPMMLPDGKAVLFAALNLTSDAMRIESLTVADGRRHVIVERGTMPLYASSGRLVFFRDGELLAAPFDAGRQRLMGAPVRVLEGISAGNAGVPVIDLSTEGSLVYSPTTAIGRLVWLSRQGAEQPLNDTLRGYANPRVAPSGGQIVVQAGDLWLQDLVRDTFSRLTSREAVFNGFPIWTPDGRRVIYRTLGGLRWIEADGSGRGQTISGTTEADYPGALAPDGDTLVLLRSSTETSFDIYTLSLRDPSKIRAILKTPAYEGGVRLSPDGRWMSYVSNESGPMEVYVRPFSGTDQRWQVSTQGGTQAIWNPNGREIFYRNGNKMMAVDVSTEPQLTLSSPHLLFEQRYAFGAGITIANYDVSRDGQRFLMVRDEVGAGRLNIVLNWFDELARRVPR